MPLFRPHKNRASAIELTFNQPARPGEPGDLVEQGTRISRARLIQAALRCWRRFRRWPRYVRLFVQVHLLLLTLAGIGLGLLNLARGDASRVAMRADEHAYAVAWGEEARWSVSSVSFNAGEWLVISFRAVNPPRRVTNISAARWSMRNRDVRLRVPVGTYEGRLTWGGRERASDLFRRAWAVLDDAQTVSVTVTASILDTLASPPMTRKVRHNIIFQPPDRIAWRVSGDVDNEFDVFSDGETLVVNGPSFRSPRRDTRRVPFSHAAGRAGIADIREWATLNVKGLPLSVWNGPDAWLEGMARLEHLGVERIGSTGFHHIRANDVEVWFTRGDRPLLRRLIANSAGIRYTYDFTDWKFDEPVPVETFKFTPSEEPPARTEVDGADAGE
jgi:hypothetical protein